ncbi:MFS transporter [Thermoactinomyces sp. DSM 45892]|uniref:MFS transporter n=1 Tax=Thermoactinomyces sp. DSM 45892 TaxID=1882753 RepID=UPI0008947A17|nr:MFS transporter [Thermoactinomyces sp. DSM 45892]SDY24044.1 MFS transporter, DHA1 family, multidrug resistance protein B [Thermoactinomyces sp. DSM 45892]
MKFADFHVNVKIRIFEKLLSGFLGNMIFPFMTIYLSQHFGTKIAGLLLMFNVLIGIGTNFISGYFSDRYGRIKIIRTAELLRFVAFFSMMICNSPWFNSPVITFFMTTINAVCWGLVSPANQAMLIDVSKPEQRKLMYSIIYWTNNISIAVSAMIGALLFNKYLYELLVALSFGSLLSIILIVCFMKESYFPTQKKSSSSHIIEIKNIYFGVFKDRLFILFTLAGILVLSMEFHLTNYIGIRLTEEISIQKILYWNIDGLGLIGILRMENTLLVVILSLITAYLVKKLKDRHVLVGGAFLSVIGFGIMTYFNNIWILIIVMIIATIGEVIKVPVQQSYLAALPPDNSRSSYMAVSGLSFNMAMLISSIIVTISSYVAPLLLSIIITGIGLIGVGIFYLILPRIQIRLDKKNQSG